VKGGTFERLREEGRGEEKKQTRSLLMDHLIESSLALPPHLEIDVEGEIVRVREVRGEDWVRLFEISHGKALFGSCDYDKHQEWV